MKQVIALRLPAFRQYHTAHGIRRYLRAHRDIWLGVIWFTGFSALVAYQAYQGWHYKPSDDTGLYLQLSRAGAFALLPVLFALWIPVLRNGMTWLRQGPLAGLLPLEYAKRAHRGLGHLLLALGLLHGSQHLLYFSTLDEPFDELLLGSNADLVRAMRTHMYEFVTFDESIDASVSWSENGVSRSVFEREIQPFLQEDCNKCHNLTSTMTYAKPEQPLSSYDDVVPWTRSGIFSRQFRIVGSGLLMLIGFTAIWIGYIAFRQRRHHWFQDIHRLGYLLAGAALLHIPSLGWIVVPVGLLAIDLLLTRHRQLYRNCPTQMHRLAPDLARLEIDCPAGFRHRPGHYVYIRIRGLGRDEWHPFSLTGPCEAGRLILKIRRSGDWTGRLLNRVHDRESTTLRLDLRGPYASPAAEAMRHKEWLLIAGGVGITPFLGLLRALADHPAPRRTVHLVWIVRETILLRWIEGLAEKLNRQGRHHFHWHIFVDGGPLDASPRPFTVQAGRPDWPRLLERIAEGGLTPDCYVCGPPGLRDTVVRECRRRRWSIRSEQF